MKALTLWQPWASLVEARIKTIETRSWATSYRGPLAIHAAARRPTALDLDPIRTLTPENYRRMDVRLGGEPEDPLVYPLGLVLATCTLVDCVPMGWCHNPLAPEVPEFALAIEYGTRRAWHKVGDTAADVSDQLFLGDFRPGRWAWLLDDIEVVSPAAPARGRQQLWDWNVEPAVA